MSDYPIQTKAVDQGCNQDRDCRNGRSPDYYATARHDVAALIPTEVRSAMEVGCAAGGTGRLLRMSGLTRLIGIEIDARSAETARRYYDDLIVGDAEELDLSHVPDQSLDCIVYADVLEHLRDPWNLLRRHLRLLRKGGFVVASIPNVRYYKAVRELVFRGKWEYGDAGILDRAHLRFFTWPSIEALFEDNGLRILRVQDNVRGPHWLKVLNKLVLNKLYHFLVKQYVVLGQKTAE